MRRVAARQWLVRPSPLLLLCASGELNSGHLKSLLPTELSCQPKTLPICFHFPLAIFKVTFNIILIDEAWYAMWLHHTTSIFLFYTHHASILFWAASLWAKPVGLFLTSQWLFFLKKSSFYWYLKDKNLVLIFIIIKQIRKTKAICSELVVTWESVTDALQTLSYRKWQLYNG